MFVRWNRPKRALKPKKWKMAEYDTAIDVAIQSLRNAGHPNEPPSPDDLHDREPPLSPTGPSIGPFTFATPHRSGPLSSILLARSPNPKTPIVALKLTSPSQTTPPHDPRRESAILSTLHHAHITPLLSTLHQPPGHFTLVFPYLPHDLSALLPHLIPTQTKSHLRDLFRALAHLHSLGIIHRDVKPANLLLRSPSGPAYLADLGIAWHPALSAASEPPHEKISDVGTTCYRPVELLFGCADYGTSLDLWAAGCVVAEAVHSFGSGDRCLFEAGDLGSELRLIASVFRTLGTPDETVWPSAKHLPDWGKMTFAQFPPRKWEDILPDAPPSARDLIGRLVRYEGAERMPADEVLRHPYFAGMDGGEGGNE